MATKQGQIPDLKDTSPQALIMWAKAMKNALGVLANDVPTTDSSALDVAVTFQDLIDAGIAVEAPKGSKQMVVAGSDAGAFVYTPPPAPSNFVVTRQPYNMKLTWDAPTYSNHLLTEIWRSPTNNLSQAYKVNTVATDVTLYEDGYVDGQAWYYWIRFISKALVPGSFNAIQGTSDNSQPGDVTGLTYAFEGFGVRLHWNPVLDADLSVYELRLGTTWETATKIDEVKGTSYLWPVQVANTYRIFIRAKDVTGFYSGSSASVDIVVSPPAQTSITTAIVGDSVSVSWQSVAGTFAIDFYELRVGTTWAGATMIDKAYVVGYFTKVDWSGTKRFWVAAKDVAGNYATPISADVEIQTPTAVTGLRAEVVDNNVLIYWSEPVTHTLPIATYIISKGTNAGDTPIGDKNGLFTSVFEQLAGSYTYWVQPVDTAGNIGASNGVTAKVNQPPDYVLYSDQNPNLSGSSVSSATWDGTGMVLPFNTTETYDAHYTSRGWTKDDDAIAAGYPVYAQPTPASGYFEFSVDYGASIPATAINVTPTMLVIAGTPTYSAQLSWKLNIGDAWTDLPPGLTGFIGSAFRYVKVKITATNGGDQKGVYRCTNVNLKLNVKLKTASGQGNCLSSDSGGTQFTLTTTRVTATGNNTSGQTTITSMSSTTGIVAGMTVEGTGVAAGTTVVSVDSSTQVTLSNATSSGTTGGTYAFANTIFSDCFGPPLVQPAGTTPIIAVVDFVDQANPQTFKVLLFNTSGTRVTADISWQARGV